jgi:adenylylsulfate kinase-like enzyme
METPPGYDRQGSLEPKVFLVTGIPGAGKTTVSRALAERFSHAVAIESDWLQEIVISGGLWPDEEPHDEAERQLTLKAKNTAMLADSYVDAGFTVVIDDVVPGAHRLDLYRGFLRARPAALAVLAPSLEVALQRDKHRGYKEVGDMWSHLDQEMREKLAGVGFWLDTSAMTVEETVDAIIANIPSALL